MLFQRKITPGVMVIAAFGMVQLFMKALSSNRTHKTSPHLQADTSREYLKLSVINRPHSHFLKANDNENYLKRTKNKLPHISL